MFSDDTLTAKVPGIYSYEGYHKGFQSQVANVVRQLNDEQSWVLGVTDTRAVTLPVAENTILEDQVRRLYLLDYTAAWKAFIAVVRIKPLSNTTEAIQTSQQLASADTPLRPLMVKIAHETTLSVDQSGAVASFASGVTNSVLASGRALTGALVGSKIQADSAVEKALVDDQFTSLRAFVTSGPDGKAQIDRVIGQIAEVQGQLIAADRAVQARTAPPASSATPALIAEASQMPEPVRTLLTTLTQQGARQTLAGLRVNLSDEIRADMGEFCQQAFTGRYPFDRNAQREAQLQDFATVFAPGGKFDQLMTKLGPYVDTSARTWRLRPIDGASLGESGSLVQLQRAQAIRDTFFAGTATPTIRVTFKPLEMDPYLSSFSLDIDGQAIRYQHGPPFATTVTWPGLHTTNQVRLNVTPAPPPGTPDLVFEGPWALLRMIDRLKLETTSAPERFIATFNIAQHPARFEVSATSVRNPLTMPELRDFRCPMGL